MSGQRTYGSFQKDVPSQVADTDGATLRVLGNQMAVPHGGRADLFPEKPWGAGGVALSVWKSQVTLQPQPTAPVPRPSGRLANPLGKVGKVTRVRVPPSVFGTRGSIPRGRPWGVSEVP